MGLHDENAAVTQVHFLPHQVKSEHSQQLFCFKNGTVSECHCVVLVEWFDSAVSLG